MKTLAAVVLAMLAGCAGAPTNTGDPRAAAVANAGGIRATAVPAGWVAIEVNDERLRCANYADDEWQVAVAGGGVQFTEAKPREPDTGPALPFTPAQQFAMRGRRHVLAVSDGFLVGFDAGEWGGALHWFSPDGTRSTQLGDENVHGLVAIAPDVIASIEGLSHLGSSEGNVRWVERRGSWRGGTLTALDAAPRTFAATTDALYVLTTESLVRVGKQDRKAKAIQPVRMSRLYPGSMAVDVDGTLWIGMRQFVVRMTPNGERFAETWLVRASCVRARVRDLDCVCAPS